MKQKLFIIKKEVWSDSLSKALQAKGRVVSIEEITMPPIQMEPIPVGFNVKKKCSIKK